MSAVQKNSVHKGITKTALLAGLVMILVLAGSPWLYGKDKKEKGKKGQPAESELVSKNRLFLENLDLSKIVWPNPPAITRIKYLNYWSGEKWVPPTQVKKKASWMERVSGIATGQAPGSGKARWQLVVPNGIAVDSKGRVYIADSKVRAIFIVNMETGEYEMIKNGVEARFQWVLGLAIDDSDRLFVSDSGMRRVLVFDPQRKVEGSIAEGLHDPGGLAIDNENRLLYVTDAEQDLVLVYDADPPYKLLRKIGTPGLKHTSTKPGEFSKPTGVAVDQDGNLFVADTWNNRIEVFDSEGNFIRTFGRAGDGPGYFARPKGVSIDADGHVWVADAMQDRVQVFTPEGRLLIWMGGHGKLPGQFESLANVYVDKDNRVITTEQFAGRAQMFRYVTNAEALAEKERRDEEAKKKAEERRSSATKSSPDAKPE
ncbi:MAG TPA: SMP-30/gluconolactonase/LRE family protein [Terriglobales bacterium]|nr:SMP-30/gluconolactonase/LRE family protein [Terriglobales bacterium]